MPRPKLFSNPARFNMQLEQAELERLQQMARDAGLTATDVVRGWIREGGPVRPVSTALVHQRDPPRVVMDVIHDHLRSIVYEVEPYRATEIMSNGKAEIRATLESARRAASRARRGGGYSLFGSKPLAREKVVEACRTLNIPPPRRGQPVDMAAAKKAKKQQARMYHPDVHGGREVTRPYYEEALAAYQLLERYNEELPWTVELWLAACVAVLATACAHRNAEQTRAVTVSGGGDAADAHATGGTGGVATRSLSATTPCRISGLRPSPASHSTCAIVSAGKCHSVLSVPSAMRRPTMPMRGTVSGYFGVNSRTRLRDRTCAFLRDLARAWLPRAVRRAFPSTRGGRRAGCVCDDGWLVPRSAPTRWAPA